MGVSICGLALWMVSGLGPASGAATRPAEVKPLPEAPPNTWVAAKVKRVLPASIPGAAWATGDGYSGATYRSKTGTILSRTGVQSKQAGYWPGFYGNATLEWDLATNEARVVEVARWGGGSGGRGTLLPGFAENPTPTPRHTYDGLTYVESQDAMYFMLGANWRVASNATDEAKAQHALDNRSTWKYTFADGKWHRIDGNVNALFKVSPYESHLQHWPEGHKLLFLDSAGRAYAEFDLRTETWAKVDLKNKCPQTLYHARSTWDTKRALWVFRVGPKCCTFNPRTREFQALPDCSPPIPDQNDKRRIWKGVAYIPKHDVYLITGPTGNDTKVLDAEKGREGTWKEIRGGDLQLVNGYAQYDPRTDQVGLVYQLTAFTFRYVPEPAAAGPKAE